MLQISHNKIANRVYNIVASIPSGTVMSYKEVAQRSGIANPRQIGKILHENPDPKRVPCHRVIRSDGTVASGFAFGGPDKQIALLESEGVHFKNGKVVRAMLQ